MHLEIFEMADRCRQVINDGSAYYFLATADNKTGSSELAYIYVEEDDWELFRIYRQHIRKHPVSGDEDFLFLNSNGRRIYNPSQDLGTILERYGEEVMTCNDARHIITTLATQHYFKDDQAIIHKMLTHTPKTADKHYNEVSDMAVPHRRGIPILETLQRKLAEKYHVKVSSFLKRTLEIRSRPASPRRRRTKPATRKSSFTAINKW